MKDIPCHIRLLITSVRPHKLIILFGLIFNLSIDARCQKEQVTVAIASIGELKEGWLIVRIPAYRTKIDTLTSMSSRATDSKNKARLEKLLQETIEERDTLLADYIQAFKTQYTFSKVAYYFDYDGRDLNTANYFNLDGERLAVADLSEKPLFYMYFERTEDSKVDALVVYNRYIKKVPSPFPNDFTSGGVNFIFFKMSSKKFPAWRVGKINKQFYKFWDAVKEDIPVL